MTPVQIFRNIAGLVRGPDPWKPSERLEQQVGLLLAARVYEQRLRDRAATELGRPDANPGSARHVTSADANER
jgi:hypothetical protein